MMGILLKKKNCIFVNKLNLIELVLPDIRLFVKFIGKFSKECVYVAAGWLEFKPHSVCESVIIFFYKYAVNGADFFLNNFIVTRFK